MVSWLQNGQIYVSWYSCKFLKMCHKEVRSSGPFVHVVNRLERKDPITCFMQHWLLEDKKEFQNLRKFIELSILLPNTFTLHPAP